MIGVAIHSSERAAASEFFELFKTHWEYYEPDRTYDVLISTDSSLTSRGTALSLIFGASPGTFDASHGINPQVQPAGSTLTHAGRRLPVYGAVATFPTSSDILVREESTKTPALLALRNGGQTVIRVGYNLFSESQFLLTVGQPARHAGVATLEHHLALLRDLITRAGHPFVEIPPVPAGYPFMVCLTHDIDHPILRNHRWDRTMFGFLFRALFVSPINVCRGRSSVVGMLRNWAAALRLPFVHLGLASDTWAEFDRYVEIESGLGSTYFFIPERGNPGRNKNGPAPAKRACQYTLAELGPQHKRITAAGNEIGLHGIDAWLDSRAGRQEKQCLEQATGLSAMGVRMHWLYFDKQSPSRLEEAGFSYDSSVGYNETIGYRAGTAQAYRPLGNKRLLELPLQVMDTALFYPSYLDLNEPEAARLIGRMLNEMAEFGGALTINWHDRSIFAERRWDTFYNNLLDEMKRRRAWFPTAAQAVGWFRKRRNASIISVCTEAGRIAINTKDGEHDTLPGLTIRIHRPCPRSGMEALATGPQARYQDVPFASSFNFEFQN